MDMILWILFLLFCIVAEAATSISLVTIWFIPGAIVSAILAHFNTPVIIQIVVFLIFSFISLCVTRKFAKKHHNTKQLEKTNADSLIGKTTLLLEDCTADKNSSVKFGDIIWTAKSINGKSLHKDTPVTVVRIEGNTLIVKEGDLL